MKTEQQIMDIPLKKNYRPGQIYVTVNRKRYGMKTLGKLAYKSEVKSINSCPF